MKILSVGAQSFRAYKRTYFLKIIVTFRSFWNAPNVIIVEHVQALEVIPVKPAQVSRDTSRNYTKVTD
jgi:hypothetical protein